MAPPKLSAFKPTTLRALSAISHNRPTDTRDRDKIMRMKERIAAAKSKQAKYSYPSLYSALKATAPSAITYNPPSTERGHENERWIENASNGLRFVGLAHDVARDNNRPRLIEHTGWYVDDFQSETVSGAVLQLPARNGVPQYLAAVQDPWNDDAFLVDFSIMDDPCDAARTANSMAETYAENAREYQRIANAEQRIDEISDELADNRARVLTILRERRSAPIAAFPALRNAICDRIRTMLTERTSLFAERETLRDQLA